MNKKWLKNRNPWQSGWTTCIITSIKKIFHVELVKYIIGCIKERISLVEEIYTEVIEVRQGVCPSNQVDEHGCSRYWTRVWKYSN